MKWDWCDDRVECVSCVLVYEVKMMWWSCWMSVMSLSMKWGWCDDVVECVSCVWVWSEDDMMMMLLSECHVFLWIKWGWSDDVVVKWVSLFMKWGWCDEIIEWVSCVSLWSEDDVMLLFSESHVFVYEVRRMRWCCWVSVLCLCMKWGWYDDDVVEWVSCVFVD